MDPLERLAREVGRSIGEGPGPERRRQQRRAVARLTAAPPEPVSWARWALPLAAVAVAVLLWIGRDTGAGSLAARVGERAFMAGSWLAAEDEPLALEFSDRSRVVFAPEAAARLVRVEVDAVTLSLERGQIELAAVADPARAWHVAAGPFTVEATGTLAAIAWQPQPRTLTVTVREGAVRVRGGTLPAAGSLIAAHQRLEVSDAAAGPSTVEASATGPIAATELEPAPDPVRRPRAEPGWRRLAAAGEHAAALAAVERVGLAAMLERLDAEDLDRLAHSARLAGAAGSARDALEVLRRRFPRDPRARTAAFLLARVALDRADDPALAAHWFGVYVQEQPSGPLAEEARGRILEIRRLGGDPQQVQAAARAYLEHHPQGSRAGLARALLAAP